MKRIILSAVLIVFTCTISQAQVKILFDATKSETAGNADWVIDADVHNIDWHPNAQVGSGSGSNPQRFPTPAQSGVISTTAETYWEGALSSWGIDCVKYGYEVETLPYNGTISYGNGSNAQDLSNYKVYIVDEPNILFTTAEKNALLQFVQNGGGLFMISDHTGSDRNNDGYDSPAIWNDFMTSVVPSNPFGFSIDLTNFSQTSTNVANLPNDSLLHGPFGAVTSIKFSNGASMTLTPSANSTVTGVIYKTGSSNTGTTNVMVAHSRFGRGKVACLTDSSPPDDGTGNPACSLYSSYTGEASGNHQRLLMNTTVWLAQTDTAVSTGISNESVRDENDFDVSVVNNSSLKVFVRSNPQSEPFQIYNVTGALLLNVKVGLMSTEFVDVSSLSEGIYFAKVGNVVKKIFR